MSAPNLALVAPCGPDPPPHPHRIPRTPPMLIKIIKAVALTLLFVLGTICVWASIALVWPLKFVFPRLYERAVARQRANFCCLLIACTQFFAGSTVIELELPEGVHYKNGYISWPHRAVVIANHQLYNDWIYTWWLSYTAGVADAPIIMLKESLRSLPFIGWGGRAFGFLYMARKWDVDAARIKRTMAWIRGHRDPAWLVMFPEGTVTSANTVQRSQKYAEKAGRVAPRNLLLPRTKGLFACLEGLEGTIPDLFDITIFYDGVPEGIYGEDWYSLKRMYWDGMPPKRVKIHVRRYDVASIPTEEAAFDEWVFQRWAEKDQIFDRLRANTVPSASAIEQKVELRTILDLLDPFALPAVAVAVVWALVR